MDNTFTGRVIAVLDEQRGISKSGTAWRQQEYVIKQETDNYPKAVCVKVKGDNIDKFGIRLGETITAHLNIDAHNWQGKWYNEITAWKIDRT